VSPTELRQRAVELEADLWPDHAEDRRGAAELLARLAGWDAALLRRALLGEAGSGSGPTRSQNQVKSPRQIGERRG
jgi:hypothetical protein